MIVLRKWVTVPALYNLLAVVKLALKIFQMKRVLNDKTREVTHFGMVRSNPSAIHFIGHKWMQQQNSTVLGAPFPCTHLSAWKIPFMLVST